MSPGALHEWVRRELGVMVPRRALLASSDAPFDYLCHAFFEGRVPGGPGRERAPADCVVWASRGGGKTFLGALATVLDLVFKPGIEVRVLGGSLEQSRRMHEHLRRLFRCRAIAGMIEGEPTERRLRLANGSRVEILAQSHTSVRGTRVQKLRCDEVELFEPEVWSAAQLTTRSMACPGPWGDAVRGSVEALSTMHRPMGLMWDLAASSVRLDGRAGAPEGAEEEPSHGPAQRVLFRWGVVDALEHCPPEAACGACALEPDCGGRAKGRAAGEAGHVAVADAIAMKRRVSLAAWESEMLCLRPCREGTVYPEFNAGEHVFRGACPDGTAVCGMDFGVRSPTVILWGMVDGEGVLRITREYVQTGRTLERHIDELWGLDRPAPAWVGIDPAGEQRNDQTLRSNAAALRAAGLVVRVRRLGVHAGIMLVRARLRPATGGARLFVHARCTRLIEALRRYHYPEGRPESLEPAKDGHDHACDALRYLVACLDRGGEGGGGSYV